MLSHNIKKGFIEYFKNKHHVNLPSSPVVPHDDPTLLFTNAGMNQFKDIFLGQRTVDYQRAVTAQKCIRVGGKHNDLDNVGHTSRHITFFEMLGNFSFGDYFKKEAIQSAFEVTTQVFGFDPEKIWATVYEDDDEAFQLWTSYLPSKRIVRMGAKDNFWMMGNVGPCGPCSELLYDRGKDFGSAKSPLEDSDGERFLEFWNLVFMQFNRDEAAHQTPLPNQSIDTGVGLERIVSLKMGTRSVFETDILTHLIHQVERQTQMTYSPQSDLAPSFHVIADHVRSLAFAIADGAQPSNLDRGYVLRKILRRAVRYSKRLRINTPFLAHLIPTLIECMGDDYPELKEAEGRICEIITQEEENFFRTLKRGGNILSSIIENAQKKKDKQITGEEAFKLKDTYGFPLEEILLIAKDTGLAVNIESFELLEHKAKEISKKAHVAHTQTLEDNLYKTFTKHHGTSEFIGYDTLESEASIIGIIRDGQFVNQLQMGEQGEVILDVTPFYAEKGGQVGDTGEIAHSSALFEVTDCQSPYPGVIVHLGQIKQGALIVGEPIEASVHQQRRRRIAAHHTATHLLHKALTDELGEHIRQSGSLVEPMRLRFDFTHHKALTEEQLRTIERNVNRQIQYNSTVVTREIPYSEAEQDREIKQFFGDKYGSIVRVVEISDQGGKELCGGTHVKDLSAIGLFRITKESSIGAGIRRIEATVGETAIDFMFEQEEKLTALANQLNTDPSKLHARLQSLIDEHTLLKSELKQMKRSHLKTLVYQLAEQKMTIAQNTFILEKVDIEAKELASLATLVMDQTKASAVFLATEAEGRCQLVLRLNEVLIQKGHRAGDLIKEVTSYVKGSGGGKPNMAQAGGQDPSGIPQAIEHMQHIFKQHAR